MRKYLTKEERKEKQMNNRTTIGLALLTIISATTGFIIRGTIDKKYFREPEPIRRQEIKPKKPQTQPLRKYHPIKQEPYLARAFIE